MTLTLKLKYPFGIETFIDDKQQEGVVGISIKPDFVVVLRKQQLSKLEPGMTKVPIYEESYICDEIVLER